MKLTKRTNGSRRVIADCSGPTMTEQHHKKSCDINSIMAKYVKTGLIDHVAKYKGTYGDCTSADYKTAQDLIQNENSQFQELPSKVRAMFQNDPGNYLDLITMEGGPEQLKAALSVPIEDPVPEIETKTPETPTAPPAKE